MATYTLLTKNSHLSRAPFSQSMEPTIDDWLEMRFGKNGFPLLLENKVLTLK